MKADCPKCGEKIVWLITTRTTLGGVWVDASTHDGAEKEFNPERHRPHVFRCMNMKDRISACKGCGALIVFVNKPKNPGVMPIDAISWDGQTRFDRAVHVSHHVTCPKAEEFRRKYPTTKVDRRKKEEDIPAPDDQIDLPL